MRDVRRARSRPKFCRRWSVEARRQCATTLMTKGPLRPPAVSRQGATRRRPGYPRARMCKWGGREPCQEHCACAPPSALAPSSRFVVKAALSWHIAGPMASFAPSPTISPEFPRSVKPGSATPRRSLARRAPMPPGGLFERFLRTTSHDWPSHHPQWARHALHRPASLRCLRAHLARSRFCLELGRSPHRHDFPRSSLTLPPRPL